MIDPKIWKPVPDQHVRESKRLGQKIQRSTSSQETEITEEDVPGFLRAEEGATRVEVIYTAEKSILLALSTALALAPVAVVTSGVGKKIHGPAKQLLEHEVRRCRDRCLFGQLVYFMGQAAKPRYMLQVMSRSKCPVAL